MRAWLIYLLLAQHPADTVPERRAAYESAYRDCGADSARRLGSAGMSREDVSVRIISARRRMLDSIEATLPPAYRRTTLLSAYGGCAAALLGMPSVYDTAAIRRYTEERADSAARLFAREHAWWRLNTHKSVVYFVVAFSAVAFAAAFNFNNRYAAARARRWWTAAGSVIGLFVGAFACLTIGMIGAFFMFLSDGMTPRQLLAFSLLTVVFTAAAVSLVPRSGRSRRWY